MKLNRKRLEIEEDDFFDLSKPDLTPVLMINF